MKKLVCILLVSVLLLGCLSGCNFTERMSGAFAGQAEATPKVEQMLAALAQDSTADAKALLHPQAAETADAAIAQMSDYLAGRNVKTVALINLNVSTSTGTAGKVRQENGGYRVTLEDDTVVYINAVYLSNPQGTGFSSFQLVLGVV